MIRSYVLVVTLLLCRVVPVSGMVPGGALPSTTILNVIKNDICSGSMIFVPALQAAVPVGAIALFKMLHYGGFSFSQLVEGEGFALIFGSLQFVIMAFGVGSIISMLLGSEPYNENNFVNSKNTFRVRTGIRYSLALLYSFLGLSAMQHMLAGSPEDFFDKHSVLLALK